MQRADTQRPVVAVAECLAARPFGPCLCMSCGLARALPLLLAPGVCWAPVWMYSAEMEKVKKVHILFI